MRATGHRKASAPFREVQTRSPCMIKATSVIPTPDEVARLFAHLAVLRSIGRGGIGGIYEARWEELDRLKSLKVLPLRIRTVSASAGRGSVLCLERAS